MGSGRTRLGGWKINLRERVLVEEVSVLGLEDVLVLLLLFRLLAGLFPKGEPFNGDETQLPMGFLFLGFCLELISKKPRMIDECTIDQAIFSRRRFIQMHPMGRKREAFVLKFLLLFFTFFVYLNLFLRGFCLILVIFLCVSCFLCLFVACLKERGKS